MTFKRHIVNGRSIADDMYASLSARREIITRPITLGIIVSGANPVIESFVRIKRRVAERLRIDVERVDMSDTADTASTVAAIKELANRTDAVIVQLPLLDHIDTNSALAAVPILKDVDAINPDIPESERPVHAPVALAVVEILQRAGIPIVGKRAVVVGAGRLVGVPSAALLRSLGAEVSVLTLKEGAIDDLKIADIIVCGAGNPGFIQPEHIKDGVAIIDAGASEQGAVIRGDADPSCAEKAAVFTPVPGGVGPVAVALIFRNLLDLVEKAEE